MSLFRNTIILMLFTYWFYGCEEKLEVPNSSLTVKVVDSEGATQKDAIVNIYSSEEDFLLEEKLVKTGHTDDQGIVIFTGLRLNKVYYLDSRKHSKTNWIGQISSPQILEGANDITLTVRENWYSNLSSADGIAWSPTHVSFDSLQWYSYLDCFNEDIYRMFKNKDMSLTNATPCEPGEIGSFKGTWFGTDQVIRMDSHIDGDYITFKLIKTSPDEFVGKTRNPSGEPVYVIFNN